MDGGWTLTCCALPAGVLFTRINVDTFPVVATAAATQLQHAIQVHLHGLAIIRHLHRAALLHTHFCGCHTWLILRLSSCHAIEDVSSR